MKLNADKCHLLVTGQRCDDPVAVKIGNSEVIDSSDGKLLGASNKFYALAAYPGIWIITN